MDVHRALQINQAVSGYIAKAYAQGINQEEVPDFDLHEALEAMQIIEQEKQKSQEKRSVEDLPATSDALSLAALYVLGRAPGQDVSEGSTIQPVIAGSGKAVIVVNVGEQPVPEDQERS